jgi:integration host factor subunit beta
MTKSVLIDRLCERCKVPAGRAEQIANAIFDAIEQSLNRDERVEIRGFGSFETRAYQGYVGRNPRTGSSVEVKPKRLPFFKAGKELKDRVEQAARRERLSRTAANPPVVKENSAASAPVPVNQPSAGGP